MDKPLELVPLIPEQVVPVIPEQSVPPVPVMLCHGFSSTDVISTFNLCIKHKTKIMAAKKVEIMELKQLLLVDSNDKCTFHAHINNKKAPHLCKAL